MYTFCRTFTFTRLTHNFSGSHLSFLSSCRCLPQRYFHMPKACCIKPQPGTTVRYWWICAIYETWTWQQKAEELWSKELTIWYIQPPVLLKSLLFFRMKSRTMISSFSLKIVKRFTDYGLLLLSFATLHAKRCWPSRYCISRSRRDKALQTPTWPKTSLPKCSKLYCFQFWTRTYVGEDIKGREKKSIYQVRENLSHLGRALMQWHI